MKTLADLLPLARLRPGAVLGYLEIARPDILVWSRSGGPDAITPQALAQSIIAALPTAFDVPAQALLGNSSPPFPLGNVPTFPPIAVENCPVLDILGSDGTPLYQIRCRLRLEIAHPIDQHRRDANELVLHREASDWTYCARLTLDTKSASLESHPPLLEGRGMLRLPARLLP